MQNRKKSKRTKYQGVIKYKDTDPVTGAVWNKEWATIWWLSHESCQIQTERVWKRIDEFAMTEIVCVYIHDNKGTGFEKVFGDFSDVLKFGEKLQPVQEYYCAKVWGTDGQEYYKFEKVRDRNAFVNVVNNSKQGHAMKISNEAVLDATWSPSFQQFRTFAGVEHQAKGLCYKKI